jgi:hypothetical protein
VTALLWCSDADGLPWESTDGAMWRRPDPDLPGGELPYAYLAAAELCGHSWARYAGDPGRHYYNHDCTEPANHPAPCRCRCGATTTRPTEGD